MDSIESFICGPKSGIYPVFGHVPSLSLSTAAPNLKLVPVNSAKACDSSLPSSLSSNELLRANCRLVLLVSLFAVHDTHYSHDGID